MIISSLPPRGYLNGDGQTPGSPLGKPPRRAREGLNKQIVRFVAADKHHLTGSLIQSGQIRAMPFYVGGA